jgi:hypothetical protein
LKSKPLWFLEISKEKEKKREREREERKEESKRVKERERMNSPPIDTPFFCTTFPFLSLFFFFSIFSI